MIEDVIAIAFLPATAPQRFAPIDAFIAARHVKNHSVG